MLLFAVIWLIAFSAAASSAAVALAIELRTPGLLSNIWPAMYAVSILIMLALIAVIQLP